MSRHTVVSARNQTVQVKVTGPFAVALQFVAVLQQYCLVSVGAERFLFCSSRLVGGPMTMARLRRLLATDVPVHATIVSSASIAALGIGTIRELLTRVRHRLFSVTPLVAWLAERVLGERAADSADAHARNGSALFARIKGIFLRVMPYSLNESAQQRRGEADDSIAEALGLDDAGSGGRMCHGNPGGA